MSVSSSKSDPPVGVHYVQPQPLGVQSFNRPDSYGHDHHNSSRLSHLSQDSHASTVHLGGVDYNIGTRVGRSFVIGDPHTNDPSFDDLNVSKSRASGSTIGSQKQLTRDSYPVLEKAYDFEYWNWTIVRFLCLGFVLVVMLALLGAVIGIVIVEKTKCQSPFLWWQGSVMYHISVPHFSNGDKDRLNMGDIQGLKEKVSYLKYLGVQVVVLSNFLSTASEDTNWEHFDSFIKVDNRFGKVSDFLELVEELHSDNIKVLLEIKPAYTATSHQWFMDSRRQRSSYTSDFDKYYIWKDSDEGNTEDGLWQMDDWRAQFYMYRGDPNKAVLNWSLQKLHETFEAVLKTWLDRGVDGFVMTGMDEMYTQYNTTKLSIVKRWRTLLDEYSTDDTTRKVLCIEKSVIDGFHGSNASVTLANNILSHVDLLQVPFALDFSNTTYKMMSDVQKGLTYQSRVNGPWTYWQLSNTSQVDMRYITEIMLYVLMLPGNPGIVAGQEIGRNVLEPGDKGDALLWRSGSIFPYLAGSMLNETTMAVLKPLATLRENTYSLREDGQLDDDDDPTEKTMSYSFPYIDKESIIIKRRYGRRDAFLFAGNFENEAITRDWFDVAAGGDIVCDSTSKLKGKLALAEDYTLQRGQGIVFKVQY